MMIGRLENGQSAGGDDEAGAERGVVGRRVSLMRRCQGRRTYLAQVIVSPGALLGTETNYTG